jgi:hypothetical protein
MPVVRRDRDDSSERVMLPDSEVGTAVLTRLADGRVRVDQADPIVHISVDLLDCNGPRLGGEADIVVDGDVISFGDINRVSYRITERSEMWVEAERIS